MRIEGDISLAPSRVDGDVSIKQIRIGGELKFPVKTPYTGSYDWIPTEEEQSIPIKGKTASDDITIEAIPSTYVGSEVPKNPSLTVNGKTVTASSGYYEEAKSASVQEAQRAVISSSLNDETGIVDIQVGVFEGYSAPYIKTSSLGLPTEDGKTITPAESEQTAVQAGKFTLGDVKVAAIPSDYVGSGITRNPELTVNNNIVTAPAGYYEQAKNGTVEEVVPRQYVDISVDAGGQVNAQYTVPKGYIANQYDMTSHYQQPTQDAQIITPSTADIVISSGKFLTGDQTIKGDADLIPNNIADDTNLFGVQGALPRPYEFVETLYDHTFNLSADTTYDSWTASTTAKAILATGNAGTFVADLANYEYFLWWKVGCDVVMAEGATLKAVPQWEGGDFIQTIFRRPNSLATIASGSKAGNAVVTQTSAPLNVYYNTSGTRTYTYSVSYGLYPAVTAATFSSSTAISPTVTVKRPTFNARCSSTYFATARKTEIDSANTNFRMVCNLYRIPITQYGQTRVYEGLTETYNTLP